MLGHCDCGGAEGQAIAAGAAMMQRYWNSMRFLGSLSVGGGPGYWMRLRRSISKFLIATR